MVRINLRPLNMSMSKCGVCERAQPSRIKQRFGSLGHACLQAMKNSCRHGMLRRDARAYS